MHQGPLSEPCFLRAQSPPVALLAIFHGLQLCGAHGSPSQPTPVPPERLCPGGQLYPDCISSCPASCSMVGQGEEGPCGEDCVSGCECPPGLFWDGTHCVPAASCPCYHRRQRYAPGDTVHQRCNPWWVLKPCWEWQSCDSLGSLILSWGIKTCLHLSGHSLGALHKACDLSWHD